MSDDQSSNLPEFGPQNDMVSAGDDVVAAPQGFGERLSNSFGAILMGLVLIPLACWGLFWNEGRAIKTARALDEGKSIVRSIGTERIDPALNGQLVHVAGETRSAGGVADADLGVKTAGLKLMRRVEMYQWIEREEGSGQDRKYVYSRDWRTSGVESGRFRAPAGHENPAFPQYRNRDFGAQDARIGAFQIGSTAVAQLGGAEEYPISNAGLAIAQRVTGRPTQVAGGGYYVGQNPGSPRVGDVRITYKIVREGPASFVGRQEAEGLQVYRAKNGQQFLLAGAGIHSSDDLFQTAHEDNRTLTWILRGVGLLVLFIGFSSLFAPVNLLASYIPILGSLVSGAVTLVAAAATAIVGPLVIAIAWFAYRPLLSVGVIAAGLAIAYGFRQLRLRRQQTMAEAKGGLFIPAR
ncbi:MAG: hypothetical protein FD175_2622 [Beijerinckiaceae bacterium]|nr:MAG: hypothetical protein FD175_2622 [Beijerinckiaceae bacterium]